MVIEVTYNVTDVYMSTTVSPIYITVDYSGSGGSGASVWGSITGTLSNQTDLQTALDGKFDDPTGTTSQYLRGDGSLATFPSLTGYVPYSGATSAVDLGEYGISAGQVTLDVSPTGTAAVGTTKWNDTIGSSQTTLKGGSVVLKNGVDLVARIVNKVSPNTTLTKAAYQAVRVSGAQGQRLAVAFAQANNDNNSADTIGLVIETIATNQEGFIITVGQIDGINTTGSLQGETWADGDVLYLSPTVAGALTNVKPTGATGHIVIIGYVEYAHANNGKIYVKVMNGWELDELHNVYISSVANNQGLFYESSTSLWKNKSISIVLGYTPEQPLTFSSPLSRSTNTVSIPVASSSANGYLSSTDWSTFNGKQSALTLTTTGTSGAATLVGNTLNIPQYSGGGGMAIGGSITSATAGSVLFAGTSGVLTQDNSNLFWDNTNKRLGIGTASPSTSLHLSGAVAGNYNGLTIQNTGSFSGGFKSVSFDLNAVWGDARLLASNESSSSGSNGFLAFYTRTSEVLSEKLRITSAGNLLVQNTSTFSGGFRSIYIDLTAVNGDARILAGNETASSGSNGFLAFYTRTSESLTEKFRVTSTGRLLLGTTTDAGYRLDVNGTMRVQSDVTINGSAATTTTTGLRVTNSNSNVPSLLVSNNNVAGFYTSLPTYTSASDAHLWVGLSLLLSSSQGGASVALSNNVFWNGSAGVRKTSGYVSGFYLDVSGQILLTTGGTGAAGSTVTDNTIKFQIFNNGNVLIQNGGTYTDAGYRLDVNGTMRVQDNLTVNKNQNGTTKIESINTTDGTGSETFFNAISDASSGQIRFGKYASSHVTYKTLVAKDSFVYNSSTGGNISILNDFASGNINFAAGGSSTVHMTIKSNGRINMSSLPTSATGLSAGDLWNDAGILKIV